MHDPGLKIFNCFLILLIKLKKSVY